MQIRYKTAVLLCSTPDAPESSFSPFSSGIGAAAIIIDVTAGSKVRTNVMLCQFSLPKAIINPAETTTTASTPHA